MPKVSNATFNPRPPWNHSVKATLTPAKPQKRRFPHERGQWPERRHDRRIAKQRRQRAGPDQGQQTRVQARTQVREQALFEHERVQSAQHFRGCRQHAGGTARPPEQQRTEPERGQYSRSSPRDVARLGSTNVGNHMESHLAANRSLRGPSDD